MSKRTELKTGKGGCLTPVTLALIILAFMAWKIAHGETDGVRFGWVGCGIHLAPPHSP